MDDQDVILVQTKKGRLGMYTMGQALFSKELMERNYSPRTVQSVALVEEYDDVLGPMLEAHDGLAVVVAPPDL